MQEISIKVHITQNIKMSFYIIKNSVSEILQQLFIVAFKCRVQSEPRITKFIYNSNPPLYQFYCF